MNFDEYSSPYKDKRTRVAAALGNTGALSYTETIFYDYIQNSFSYRRFNDGKDVFGKEIRVLKIPDVIEDVYKYARTLAPVQYTTSSATVFMQSDEFLIKGRSTSNSIKFEIYGEKSFVDLFDKFINSAFDVVTTTIDWVTNTDMNTAEIPLIMPHGISDSSYPFLEDGVEAFVNGFLKSSENVLLLSGIPGGGKSTLVKYIIGKSKRNALVTYDPNIMVKDDVFAMFSEGDYGSMIMEDADAFLGRRVEGNQMMHKFLNSSDGIVSNKGKKLIFTTNIENVDEIDPALLRPGRCFSVIQFRKLTYQESLNFLADHDVGDWVPEKGESYSLAELYNHTKRKRSQDKRKVGFY